MDPLTVANSLIGVLTPIIAKGMGEVANSAFKDVYNNIKVRLSREPQGERTVEQFEKNPSQGAADFQALLVGHLNNDQELMNELMKVLENPKTHSALVGKVEAKNVVIADKIDKIDMS